MARIEKSSVTAKRRGIEGFGKPLTRRWLSGVLLFAALVAGGGWGAERLADPRFMPLRVVHIEGDYRYLQRSALERAVAGHVSVGFFSVDVHEVGAAARALGWVDEVRVRRVWPDALRMYVVEQVPMARWGRDSLLNERGEVFAPGGDPRPQGLAQLDGPDGSAARVSDALRSMQRLLDPLQLGIRRLELNARGGWSLELDEGLVLKLGNEAAESRLARFVRLYPRLVASRQERPVLVDLRYANGFSVRWETAPDHGIAGSMPSQGRRAGRAVEAAVETADGGRV